MKGLENQTYLIMWLVSNVLGMLFIWAAFKRPKLARLMFLLLFGWASWFNMKTAIFSPDDYLMYADMAVPLYRDFILGWFAAHIQLMVSIIAVGQGFLSIGMLLNGWWVRLSCFGIILFLLSIAPLGVGAGFPFSVTVSIAAVFVLIKDDKSYLWRLKPKPVLPA